MNVSLQIPFPPSNLTHKGYLFLVWRSLKFRRETVKCAHKKQIRLLGLRLQAAHLREKYILHVI